ncbi:MAG: phosphopantetheine adenylyltransferase [Panacagrimonas sp.]
MTERVVEYGFVASLLAAGLIHLIPVSGAISARWLHALYGISVSDDTLILLLRHRALLFGLLGLCLVVASFTPAWRTGAAELALVSMLSFVALAGGRQEVTPAIRRVIRTDLVLSAVLGTTLVARLLLA